VLVGFSRIADARAPAAGGAGLGLAIAADIVERHGGTISVVDHDGQGACVVITLPRAPSV
jgi:signal transduction histidine kinase